MWWILVAIASVALVGLIVYFITGSIVRYRGGITTCPQMLPHFQTWRWIAIHIRDGVCCVVHCGKRRPPPAPVNPFDDSRPFSTLPGEEDVDMDDDDEFHNAPVSTVAV